MKIGQKVKAKWRVIWTDGSALAGNVEITAFYCRLFKTCFIEGCYRTNFLAVPIVQEDVKICESATEAIEWAQKRGKELIEEMQK